MTDWHNHDHDNQLTVVILAVVFSTLSFLASILTLYLIKRLDKWNGYIQLVVSLTVCQIIYDLSFLFLLIPSNLAWGEYLYFFSNTFGGMSSSLWSNVIILVTARIVIRLRTVDTLKKYRMYCAGVMIPSVSIALASVLDPAPVIISYVIIRCLSIVLNILAIAVIFLKISIMYRPVAVNPRTSAISSQHSNTVSNNSNNSAVNRSEYTTEQNIRTSRRDSDASSAHNPNANPVFVLSKRLVYYCVVQTITRVGSLWYQLAYGFGDEYDASEASTAKTIIYISEFVLNPSAGIGYLIVFLLIQPEAWFELRAMFGFPLSRRRRRHKRQIRKDTRDSAADNNSSSLADNLNYHNVNQFNDQEETNASGNGLSRYNVNHVHNDADSDDELEEEYDSIRDTTATLSSNDSSLFPLLDNMTEDDLAREIERRYNPEFYLTNKFVAEEDEQKKPLITIYSASSRYRMNN